MSSNQTVLSRLKQLRKSASKKSASAVRALSALESIGEGALETRSFTSTAAEVLRLWETRLGNTRLTRVHIPGGEKLVERLKKIESPETTEIEQFGLNGSMFAGSIFFDKETGAFLGETLVLGVSGFSRIMPPRSSPAPEDHGTAYDRSASKTK